MLMMTAIDATVRMKECRLYRLLFDEAENAGVSWSFVGYC
ncbi:hypothetical protein TIFTF001_005198 [Ficus carica]|uniref:Uncharacterized protein n=1 Tax=Ficus carica TaxID=3494 RepID=A0AA88CX79_FICCA|nr:hypothetical protein TIFTF001_005198 [Ficus carica]